MVIPAFLNRPPKRGGRMLSALVFLAGALPAVAGQAQNVTPAGPGTDASGAASPWAANDHAAVRLVSATKTVPADGRLRLGLQFRMKPGWHIYWRAPGDAGIPPQVDWSASANLADPAFRWPLPERYTIFGLTTFVYGDEVVLPIAAHAPDPGGALKVRAVLNYLVCEEICVPYQTALALDLPPGDGAPSEFGPLIAQYESKVPDVLDPGQAADAPLAVTGARLVRGREGNLSLELLARSAQGFDEPEVLVEGPAAMRFGKPRTERAGDGRMALLTLPVGMAGKDGVPPVDPELTLTLADRGLAVEQRVTAITAAEGAGTDWLWILALAFLGGLILNLMPCVLPVLSMKVMSVLGHGGGDRRAVRRGFLATAAGIVFSFWVLAGLALGLKATGTAVGWGIQFQSPLFLALMAVVVTLFAANLFGLFAIPLPGFAGRLGGTGGDDGHRLGGAFATGAFATLLATPCTAPFLGTALGFALSRGTLEILAVFTVLGVGLAAPYLLVAAYPRLATALPRPGAWMTGLRMALGAVLLLTALWLLSVLWTVAGLALAAIAGGLLAALLAVLVLRHRRMLPGAAGAGLACILAAAVLAAPFVPLPAGRLTAPDGAIPWRPFDKVEVMNLVAQGKTVFVDVTADWCVTCQANKALVIDRGAVAERLSSDVVPVRADWTRPDPAIAAYLHGFGRFGIPFNAVYGPGAPGGIVLPELLTTRAVLDAIRRAQDKSGAAEGRAQAG